MKRMYMIIALGCAAVVTAGAQGGTQTPALPTVDQILDKYVTAVGGSAALGKVTSSHARGAVEIVDAQVNGTFEISQKAPNKSLQVVDLGASGKQREGFDGRIGWIEDAMSAAREKTGADLAEARRGAIFPREINLKLQYPTMTVTGREAVGTRDAFVVTGTPADSPPVRLFFDVESGLLVRQIVTRQSPAGPMQVDVTFDDFRVVDGVKRAYVIKQVNPQFTAVIRLSEVKYNVPLDDAMFRKPGG
jgi:hypothetical protein